MKLAGPIVYGLKFATPVFAFVKVPPFAIDGAIISLGWPPPIASRVTVLPTIVKSPWPPAPRKLVGVPEV
jgi:hypothetical protein